MEKEIMESVNNETVCNMVTKSNGGKVAGLVLGALGVAGGIAATLIYKKKKQNSKTEIVEAEQIDDEK